ncbi:hypothetical protein C0W35_21725 [Photobacterium kishitanii]|nr:hypothetical protein C0W35_21725 [Photobacterium kishitanii]PSV06767.1 hypothetical protein C0W28_21585 [Photobacterium kishitanii]
MLNKGVLLYMAEDKVVYSTSDSLEIKSQIELAEAKKGESLTDVEKEIVIAETLKKLAAYKLRADELRKAKIRKTHDRKKESNSDVNWSWSANTYRR